LAKKQAQLTVETKKQSSINDIGHIQSAVMSDPSASVAEDSSQVD
jgi:hypothetical protein